MRHSGYASPLAPFRSVLYSVCAITVLALPSIRAAVFENLSAYERAVAILALFAFVLYLLEKRFELVTRFFQGSEDPLNLAVVRVVVFTALLLQENYSRVVFFSSLPHALQVPPLGWGPVLRWLPINPQLASLAYVAFATACVAAIFGIFTRWSTLTTALLGVYVLGIPQFYGKVNHYHHLLWFATVLAFSRCGDALSVDSLISAAKRADMGNTRPPAPSNAYRYPIRIMLLLLSFAYLFPGVWKTARGGLAWVMTDNLKIIMYEKWMEFGSWTPALRPDHYPLLLRLAAAGTIAFEITFLLLVLFPRTRVLVFIAGLGFHNSIGFLMRIPFVSLQLMYVCFVDWKRLFELVGKHLFPQLASVVFDGNCEMCRRTVAILQTLNWYDRVQFISSCDVESLTAAGLSGGPEKTSIDHFLYIAGDRSLQGFDAYAELTKRIPIMSPLWFLIILPPLRQLGRKVYLSVARSRTCSVQPLPQTSNAGKKVILAAQPSRVLMTVGMALIAVNMLHGVLRVTETWPFACYPAFDKLLQPQYDSLILIVRMKGGLEQRHTLLGDPELGSAFSPERLGGALYFADKQEPGNARDLRFGALWSVWCRYHKVPDNVEYVTFERDQIVMDVKRRLRTVTSSEDIETIHPR